VLLKQKDGLFLVQFPELLALKGVWHGIFMRLGGTSPKPFDTLNVSKGTKDALTHIETNRKRIAGLIPPGKIVAVHQTHGTRILNVAKAPIENKRTSLCADAMISQKKALFLMIQVADCQAIFLIDPLQKVVANVHSGWRGSVANILGKTILAMVNQYGCKPEHIVAGVGPSLGPCCAEFVNYQAEIPPKFWSFKDDRDHFDFWAISRDQLKKSGVKNANIHVSQICTHCNPHLFFSYRFRPQTGRFAAIIGLT
jgi:YfiH family protein